MNTSDDTANTGPLTGCRVLELGSTVAGPFCGRLFADFGAEVIKVEAAAGDTVRTMASRVEGKSMYAASIFRNKRNISVNLRQPAGQEVIKRLAAKCDFVIENFRPGTMEKWGLGYDDLAAINPGIILIRISGFGQTGPYSQRAGFGITTEAVSGLRDITGHADQPPPRVGIPLTDYITGTYATLGAVMALVHRQKTGRGQVVDAALYEGAFSFMEPHIPAFAAAGTIPQRTGATFPGSAPNNLYTTKDGRHFQLAAANDALFKRLADVMEMPELVEDPRFSSGIKRAEHMAEIDAIIDTWIGERQLEDVEKIFVEAGIPSARIYTVADIFEDPHYRARDMLVEVPDEDLGSLTLTGVVPKLSATPGTIRWAGRVKGADTEDVLSEIGGYSTAEIEKFEADGIIFAHRPARQ